jgi:hypothetical protein
MVVADSMTPMSQGTPRLGPNIFRRNRFAGKDLGEGRCDSTESSRRLGGSPQRQRW